MLSNVTFYNISLIEINSYSLSFSANVNRIPSSYRYIQIQEGMKSKHAN